MSNSAYSDLKAAWHTSAIEVMRNGEQIVPRQVQLIISDLCNQDCHFCAYRMSGGFSTEQFRGPDGEKNPNRRIPTEKCIEILEDCAELGVRAIQFTGGGEPTVHSDHMEIFAHAQSLGLETSLVTNGVRLTNGWERVLPQMKWIRVSVDAGTADTYSRVRRVPRAHFDRAVAHIAMLREEIKKAGTDCLLGVGFVVTRENYLEIEEACVLFKEAGAPYIRMAAMFSDQGAGYYDGIYENIKFVLEKCRLLNDSSFRVVDLFGDRISDLVQHAPDYEFCGYQQFNCYIGGNLKVYRCCTTSYTAHGDVGDLTDKSFKDWFNSEAKFMAYSDFNARTCHHCQFNNKNRVINYMLDGDPVHVNFV